MPVPGGGSPDKPVGLVHFAAASRDGTSMHAAMRYGDIGRAQVREKSVLQALAMLREAGGATLGAFTPINLVRALLERGGEFAERRVEHRAHQHGQRAALEFVVDEEFDLAGAFRPSA